MICKLKLFLLKLFDFLAFFFEDDEKKSVGATMEAHEKRGL